MNRVSASIVFGLAMIIAVPVLADSSSSLSNAGRKGYVSAYDADQKTVIDVQQCDAKGGSYDYVECGKSLRSRVDGDVCKKKGKGKQIWYYQVSESSAKSKQTVKCDGTEKGSGGAADAAGSSSSASASSSPSKTKNAGEEGYVTAYDADKTTALDTAKCDPQGATFNYPECGKPFRERMGKQICSLKGKGKHTWYYQVGDAKIKSPNTVKCD
jgi:hypothetical protein